MRSGSLHGSRSRARPPKGPSVVIGSALSVDELGLKVGDEAVCVVSATSVIVEIPSAREPRA